MILPHGYLFGLILLILGVLCWGAWANTFKLTRNWRFEYYVVDWALGVALAALIYAFTLGSLGFDGFSVMDDLSHAFKRFSVIAFCGGAALSLGTMLILGALSIAGMSVAFPIGVGLGLSIGIFVRQLIAGAANRGLLLGGILCSVAAMVMAGWAHATAVRAHYAAIPKDPKKKAPGPPSSAKGLILCVVGGLVMAGAFPLLDKSIVAEIGLGPYALTMMMGLGVLICSMVGSIFLMNLPVEGEPLEVMDFFRGPVVNHFFGWLGGVIWCTGILILYVLRTARTETQIGVPPPFSYLQMVPLVGAFFGVFVWREYAESGARSKILLALLLTALAAVLMVSPGL